jgi:hypothetical protein
MNRLLSKLVFMVMVVNLVYPTSAFMQESPTTKKSSKVRITRGPEIERADPDFAIIRWKSNNPGGSPVHYGIVRYGTDRKNLGNTAKSPIRLNPGHSETVFRVRVYDLKPGTTYFYAVDSMEANGQGNQIRSPVKSFTTPRSR